MKDIQKIGKIEAIALALAIITNNIIFNITSIIFNSCGSGSWLNMIYVSILSLIFMFVILFLFKSFPGLDLLDISKFLGGKTLNCVVSILYVLLFMFFSAICVRYYANNLHLIYFSGYSILFLILLAFIPIIISSKTGLRAIYGTNLIVIPIAVLSIVLLFSVSIRDFTWQKLFPIFGYGAKELFINQSINVFSFNIIGYLYFLPSFLKDMNDFKKVSIFSVILCGLYFLLTILALTMTFSFTFTADESISLYLISRLVSLGRFFERLDAIFIFTWILAFLSFISFNVYLMSFIVKKGFGLGDSKELVYSISVILIGCSLVFKNIATLNSFARNFYKIYMVILVFGVSFIITLLAYFKKKRSLR